jgi:hypothetical protein
LWQWVRFDPEAGPAWPAIVAMAAGACTVVTLFVFLVMLANEIE